jgi:hypothetical protein
MLSVMPAWVSGPLVLVGESLGSHWLFESSAIGLLEFLAVSAPSRDPPLFEACRRPAAVEDLDASIDRVAEAETEWPADRESACKVCRCSYYLGATDLTEWKRLVEGGTDP